MRIRFSNGTSSDLTNVSSDFFFGLFFMLHLPVVFSALLNISGIAKESISSLRPLVACSRMIPISFLLYPASLDSLQHTYKNCATLLYSCNNMILLIIGQTSSTAKLHYLPYLLRLFVELRTLFLKNKIDLSNQLLLDFTVKF